VDFTKHIQKAEEALRRRNWDFAVQLYQQLLDIDPDQGEARAGLRRALLKREEQKKGGKLFKAIRGATPLAMARTLAKAGRHAAAAKSLETYLSTNPLDEEANLLLGVELEAAGHFRSALAVYEFLTEIAPKNPEGLKRAGGMMRHKGDVQKALAYYERALEADPRDRDALKARKDLSAEAALKTSRLDEVGHSREVIRDKDEAHRLEQRTRLHRSPDELRADVTRLEARRVEEPSNPELMIELADVHEKLGDAEAALELVERAMQYKKDAPELAAKRGELRVKSIKKAIVKADRDGRREDADRLEKELIAFEVEDLERRLESTPTDARLRVKLGRALLRTGTYDRAASELQKALADPAVADEALFLLAQCFHRKGYLDLARKEYERALAKHPTIDERAREILYNLGSIAEIEGDARLARSFYARIYEVDIGYRDVAAKMEQLK
jgi:tetratricopeptide (TPR) repeat protein